MPPNCAYVPSNTVLMLPPLESPHQSVKASMVDEQKYGRYLPARALLSTSESLYKLMENGRFCTTSLLEIEQQHLRWQEVSKQEDGQDTQRQIFLASFAAAGTPTTALSGPTQVHPLQAKLLTLRLSPGQR
jgi:hypothetical protein